VAVFGALATYWPKPLSMVTLRDDAANGTCRRSASPCRLQQVAQDRFREPIIAPVRLQWNCRFRGKML
jgi:hypothetical protein